MKQLANQISAVKHTVDVTFGPELSHPLLPPSPSFSPPALFCTAFSFHQKKSVLVLESNNSQVFQRPADRALSSLTHSASREIPFPLAGDGAAFHHPAVGYHDVGHLA